MNKTGLTANRSTPGASLQKKQLQTLKHQVEQLGKFLIRVTKHYEGIAPDLDKELQVLRSHLGGQANFALAEVSMSKLTGILLKNQDSLKRQSTRTSSLLEKTIKQLQAKDHLPASVRSDATDFLLKLQTQSKPEFDALPQFERAISIYRQALENLEQSRTGEQPSPAEKSTGDKAGTLHDKIVNELRELVDQLSSKNRRDKQLIDVKSKLLKGLTREELLECCLIIIKSIVKDVVKERTHAEKFVTELHQSLTKVSQSVGQSIEDVEEQYQAKVNCNEQLREQLGSIEKAVEGNHDLSQLKAQASEYINKMNATLDSREQADKDEQLILMNLLTEMQSQLSSLERETADYKHRLVEQKLQSHHDALTQVPNRTAYDERILLEYRRWKRHGHALSIALVDVDLFKKINDNYGHAAGDKTLQVIAQNISRCLRSTDFLARWGGEEFVVLLPQTSRDELGKPLETIRKQIQRIPFKFKDEKVTITVSVGATQFLPDDTIESAFERADQGLYEAKHTGRNTCIVK